MSAKPTVSITKIDHIGVAVKNIDNALRFYKDALGLAPHTEEIPTMKLKVAKLDVAGVKIELIEPQAGEESVAKFIANRGEGIHHICFDVPDVREMARHLESKGYKPLFPEPKTGAGGRTVNFLSPKDTNGVLIEISQP